MNHKNSSSLRTVFIFLSISFGAVPVANAGAIFLSGDTNIVNPLAGTSGTVVDAGNQQLFSNFLQGGSSVLVLDCNCAGGGTVGNADSEISNFYNTLGGVASSILAAPVSGAALSGIDLFVVPLPDDAFSGAEIAAMQAFVASSGSIFFLGENDSPVFVTANAAINSALAGLSSSMSIVPDNFDPGFQAATGGQIAADPFTAGVASLTYAAPSRVAGGTTLFSGTQSEPFVAYEGSSIRVPEPLTVLLLGSGLMGIGALRRR